MVKKHIMQDTSQEVDDKVFNLPDNTIAELALKADKTSIPDNDNLDTEIANRIAADIVLQNNIDTLSVLRDENEDIVAQGVDGGLKIGDYTKRLISPKFGGSTGDYPAMNVIDVEIPSTKIGTYSIVLTILGSSANGNGAQSSKYLIEGAVGNTSTGNYNSIKLLNINADTTNNRKVNVALVQENNTDKIRVSFGYIYNSYVVVADVTVIGRFLANSTYLQVNDIVLSTPFSGTIPTFSDIQSYTESRYCVRVGLDGSLKYSDGDCTVTRIDTGTFSAVVNTGAIMNVISGLESTNGSISHLFSGDTITVYTRDISGNLVSKAFSLDYKVI